MLKRCRQCRTWSDSGAVWSGSTQFAQSRSWSECSSKSSLIWVYTVCPNLRIRATEILKSKSVRSTDDVIDVIRTWVRQCQIVMQTLHFHPKVYQKLIIFLIQSNSNLLWASCQGIIQNRLLKTGACLIQGSIYIRCGVWIHLFFSVSQRVSFFYTVFACV